MTVCIKSNGKQVTSIIQRILKKILCHLNTPPIYWNKTCVHFFLRRHENGYENGRALWPHYFCLCVFIFLHNLILDLWHPKMKKKPNKQLTNWWTKMSLNVSNQKKFSFRIFRWFWSLELLQQFSFRPCGKSTSENVNKTIPYQEQRMTPKHSDPERNQNESWKAK